MKVCIIGSVGHTGYVLKGLQQQKNVELVGIAPASNEENVDQLCFMAAQWGHNPEKYENYIVMLDKLKPDVAAIACHFNNHATVTLHALERGIHVFVEKPLATTLEQLQLVQEAYRKSNVHLAAMFGIRYTSHFLTAKQIIEDGAIGSIRLMNAQKTYKLKTRSPFYKNRTTYGGTIPWVGSHAIDWMYWLSEEPFHSVYASHSTFANQDHGDLEATALCHFVFKNEVFGSINIDYLRPLQAPTHDDDRIRISGTKGVLEVRDRKVFLVNNEAAGIREMALLPSQEIFCDFLKQVRGEGTCMISAEQSFMVTEACLKARLSADEHKVIYFEEGR